MCGITGFLETHRAEYDFTQVGQSMADRIAHRGPDSSGVWIDQSQGIALSHRRLSVLELSPEGHQPMLSSTQRYVITYNGEIYNHLELRTELSAQASRWRGRSDTETILACVEAWGIEQTLKRVKGMFAFGLWDRKEQKLYLCRDRYGEKPLYYGWQGSTFLFGSELSSLKAHPSFKKKISQSALELYLRYNYVPAPRSIYENISKLVPGTWLEIDLLHKDARPKPYWSLVEVASRGDRNSELSEADAADQLERVLTDAVRRQTLSDVPIGALLSGGIDSSLICALMQSVVSSPINTFTIGFDENAFNEAHHARDVASHLGTNHTEVFFSDKDCLELIPSLPRIYDEPFADSSQLPTSLVMKLARSKVTVALSGDGGDEVFAGYNRYALVPKLWNYLKWMPEPLRVVASKLLRVIPASRLNAILNPSLGYSQMGDKLHRIGNRLTGLSSSDDLYMALVSEWRGQTPLIRSNLNPMLHGFGGEISGVESSVERMMIMDGLTYLPGDILTKVDRAAMSHSLEVRAPFLDPDVAEFAWGLDMSHKLQGGEGKKILRRVLGRYLPDHLFNRPKQGFSIPLDEWLRGSLRDWGEELLSTERLEQQGLFNVSTIRSAWRLHQTGSESYGYRLWSVLMFQAWLDENEH